MGYLDQLIQLNAYQQLAGGRYSGAYASLNAPYEVQSPQSPQPNPYTLATTGYRKNTLIYAAINYRARAIAEAPLQVISEPDTDNETVLTDHPVRDLLRAPNPYLTEEQFWQIAEINLLINGFSAWELELSRGGEPLALWPMRGDWCQFYRGEGQPIRAIRYQPYGLPPADVPIERVLLFQYYDPIYPLLKGLSPLGVALGVVEIDNFATGFLRDFMAQGAMPSGLLTTDQILTQPEADRLRDRWQAEHGGAENWSKIAVLGQGVSYQNLGAAFTPGFDFTKIDGRDEVRMCMAIGVEPILIGAQIGLASSTYSNYAEARKAFYEGHIAPEWRYLSSEVREQLIPKFEANTRRFSVRFDLSAIKALQEDRTNLWTRAQGAWSGNLITRDEARTEMGLNAIDNAPVFYADTLSFAAPNETDQATPPADETEPPETPEDEIEDDIEDDAEPTEVEDAAAANERKQFKAYVRHGKDPAGFVFKHLSADSRQALLTAMAGAQASDTAAPFRGQSAQWAAYP